MPFLLKLKDIENNSIKDIQTSYFKIFKILMSH